jgi:exosome complex exonuclease DIS3/RRP44
MMRPPVRGQTKSQVPTVVLMTDDVANRQKAEREAITTVSGMFISTSYNIGLTVKCWPVRDYVEAMKDSSQLLDLLSVAGSNDIEPTKAVAGRTALYPDVRPCLSFPSSYLYISSIFLQVLCSRVSKQGSCTRAISTPINITIWR